MGKLFETGVKSPKAVGTFEGNVIAIASVEADEGVVAKLGQDIEGQISTISNAEKAMDELHSITVTSVEDDNALSLITRISIAQNELGATIKLPSTESFTSTPTTYANASVEGAKEIYEAGKKKLAELIDYLKKSMYKYTSKVLVMFNSAEKKIGALNKEWKDYTLLDVKELDKDQAETLKDIMLDSFGAYAILKGETEVNDGIIGEFFKDAKSLTMKTKDIKDRHEKHAKALEDLKAKNLKGGAYNKAKAIVDAEFYSVEVVTKDVEIDKATFTGLPVVGFGGGSFQVTLTSTKTFGSEVAPTDPVKLAKFNVDKAKNASVTKETIKVTSADLKDIAVKLGDIKDLEGVFFKDGEEVVKQTIDLSKDFGNEIAFFEKVIEEGNKGIKDLEDEFAKKDSPSDKEKEEHSVKVIEMKGANAIAEQALRLVPTVLFSKIRTGLHAANVAYKVPAKILSFGKKK